MWSSNTEIYTQVFLFFFVVVVFLITKLLFLTKWVVYSKCNRTPTQGLALYRSTPPCAKMIYRFSILLLLPRSLILLLLFTYGLYVFSLPIEKLMDRPESAGWRLDVDAERGPSDVLGLGEWRTGQHQSVLRLPQRESAAPLVWPRVQLQGRSAVWAGRVENWRRPARRHRIESRHIFVKLILVTKSRRN